MPQKKLYISWCLLYEFLDSIVLLPSGNIVRAYAVACCCFMRNMASVYE